MLGLSGCGMTWGDTEARGDGDLALAALTRGDYAVAEQRAADTLRTTPNDPYALLAMALIHQRMGHFDRARGYYEAILAAQPQGTVAVGAGMRDQPITEVARQNLAQMGMAASPSPAPTQLAPTPPSAAAPQATVAKAAAAPAEQG
ncbi:MAG: tetratricopeptide repeat protein, partial [Alphaproteobacteria bacterium]|nr:tetratricopeptide repeat protein [Alphaproteobacteria bacterium]